MTYRRLKQITLVWIAALIIGSLSPIEVKVAVGTETESRSPEVRRQTFNYHRFMHYVGFGVGAALLVAVSRTFPQRFIYCLGLAALGCALEWTQYAMLGSRHLETWDMRDDAIAVAIGAAIAIALRLGAQARQQAFPEDAVTP